MAIPDHGTSIGRVTAEVVLGQLRKHNFAVLSTVGDDGTPHSAGVNYGLSDPDHEVAIYVMTRRHLQKTRDIARNARVSLVIPLPRRILWFVPPPTIQLRGHAEILDWTDEAGNGIFRGFWMGRRILEAYGKSHARGETRICFLKMTPDPVIRTYMVGTNLWELLTHMESGAARVVIPTGGSGERGAEAAT